MKAVVVPVGMFLASCLMALAWLGHLRQRDSIGFGTALGLSWLQVLPEYVLNVAATRFGYGTYSGAQMATFHLAFGVVCVAVVSRFVLGERLTPSQIQGFVLLKAGWLSSTAVNAPSTCSGPTSSKSTSTDRRRCTRRSAGVKG